MLHKKFAKSLVNHAKFCQCQKPLHIAVTFPECATTSVPVVPYLRIPFLLFTRTELSHCLLVLFLRTCFSTSLLGCCHY